MLEDVVTEAEYQPMHNNCNEHEELGFHEMNHIYEEEDAADARRNQNAQFILKTKETNLLTQKCLDNIVDDSTELVRGTVKAIKSGLHDCLENAGINFNAIPGLNDLFAEENPISNPFQHVSTKYKQNAYFKEHFGLVVSAFFLNNMVIYSSDKCYKFVYNMFAFIQEPKRITVGHSSVKRRSGTKYKEKLKDDEIVYIPVLQSLEQMLNIDSVLQEVLSK